MESYETIIAPVLDAYIAAREAYFATHADAYAIYINAMATNQDLTQDAAMDLYMADYDAAVAPALAKYNAACRAYFGARAAYYKSACENPSETIA